VSTDLPEFILRRAQRLRSQPTSPGMGKHWMNLQTESSDAKWRHVCASHQQTPDWVTEQHELDSIVIEAMVAGEIRPRISFLQQ